MEQLYDSRISRASQREEINDESWSFYEISKSMRAQRRVLCSMSLAIKFVR